MTLGNMRQLGVQRLVATCLNDACRHQGIIDVSTYPADTEVPWFANKVVCAKCVARSRHIDVRPNWKEQPPRPSLTGESGLVPTSTSNNRQVEDSVQGTQSKWRQPRRQSGRDSKPPNFRFSIRTREKTD
jgi:hypothetical protein